jgi:hypothetical protein
MHHKTLTRATVIPCQRRFEYPVHRPRLTLCLLWYGSHAKLGGSAALQATKCRLRIPSLTSTAFFDFFETQGQTPGYKSITAVPIETSVERNSMRKLFFAHTLVAVWVSATLLAQTTNINVSPNVLATYIGQQS